MAAAPASSGLTLDWEMLSPSGPAVAFHAGCIIKNQLYVHGGVIKYGNNVPCDKLYKLDLTSLIWSEVQAAGSPALSHHACVALDNRYMLLIGGWDGRVRTSQVHVYDTSEDRWLHPTVQGFPDGAGLSSHTALLFSSGEIMIVGREGSLRTQRKHGSAYTLTGSVEKGLFTYSPHTSGTASRSGHTSNIVGSSLFIVGGRDDRLVEMHSGYQGVCLHGKITEKFSDIAFKLKPLSKLPCGRKNHIAVSGSDALFIHGGETFDGRSREPVGEMYIITTKPKINFYKVGNSKVGRAGHCCASSGDRVIIHGGIGMGNRVHGDSYELKIK
ncbi:hypothetical protein ACJMK2_000144 [Sinanodonta woodiana]|uniref:Kelch domain-containing protein 9 n=1 Tax=Sinanodonta woodiana TaxID=1069815 RepID=A0ABD3XNH8_SINWO